MKYFASDIVKKARIAADLVNSDFITWYEEVSLLNDTYVGLYQNLIEVNDASFVEVFETTSNYAVLPSDFYQLKSVTLVRNGYSTPVLRRSPSESYKSLSYEIRKDIIYFYSPLVQMQGGVYRVEYFRTPKTLTFKPEKKIHSYTYIDAIRSNSILDSKDNYVISNKDHVIYFYEYNSFGNIINYLYQDNYTVENMESYESFDIILSYITDKYCVLRYTYKKVDEKDENGNIIEEGEEGEKYIILNLAAHDYNFPNGNISVETAIPVIFEDGNVGIYNLESREVSYTVDGITIGKEVFNLPVDADVAVIFTNMDFSDQWFQCTNKELYHFGDKIIDAAEKSILLEDVHYRRGTIYGLIKPNRDKYLPGGTDLPTDIVRIYNDDTYDVTSKGGIIAIGDLDDDTGLSYIAVRQNPENQVVDDIVVYLEPFVEDTLLDYPNSFFFQVLTYALAVQYKIKQGADAAALTALYMQYLETFMRGANNDVYSPSRVTNVYSI